MELLDTLTYCCYCCCLILIIRFLEKLKERKIKIVFQELRYVKHKESFCLFLGKENIILVHSLSGENIFKNLSDISEGEFLIKGTPTRKIKIKMETLKKLLKKERDPYFSAEQEILEIINNFGKQSFLNVLILVKDKKQFIFYEIKNISVQLASVSLLLY